MLFGSLFAWRFFSISALSQPLLSPFQYRKRAALKLKLEQHVMKSSLCAGLTHEFSHVITSDKTVPHVYPESDLFRAMPQVFATAYLVGLVEWACMEAMRAHLDPDEQSVGIDIRISHLAATPPGFRVTVRVRVERVEGRRIAFQVEARDGLDLIGEGSHERVVIQPQRFLAKVEQKRAALASASAPAGTKSPPS